MGGEHSGCDENTVDVLIESALWDPMNIAKSGRALGIITDARYRFERGVDPEYMVAGLERTTQLVARTLRRYGRQDRCRRLQGLQPPRSSISRFRR
jgi:phenylalanyl-tRNA synthetase beta chain